MTRRYKSWMPLLVLAVLAILIAGIYVELLSGAALRYNARLSRSPQPAAGVVMDVSHPADRLNPEWARSQP